ncbi:hypothetical protein ACFL2K_01565 [Candidatus Margulisiibacteriota bacterium]
MENKIIEINSQKLENILQKVEKEFTYSKEILEKIALTFQAEMKAGLAGKESSLAMIPSYLAKPNLASSINVPNEYLALDFGGTNLRLMKVNLEGNNKEKVIEFNESSPIAPAVINSSSSNVLFEFIAQKIKEFLAKPENKYVLEHKEVPMGYTFSFPYEQTAESKGFLLKWAKGFKGKDAIGKDMVEVLEKAMQKEGIQNIRIKAIINDTTGTLLAGQHLQKCDTGMILGTGSNICVNLPVSYIQKKINPYTHDKMIIVMECGNFDIRKAGVHTVYDEILDNETDNKGHHLAEKILSGKYLGSILRVMLRDAVDNLEDNHLLNKFETIETKTISEIETINIDKDTINAIFEKNNIGIKVVSDEDAQIIQKLCAHILIRSAHLTAAELTATIKYIDPELKQKHTVAMDGTVYKKAYLFKEKVASAFALLGAQNISIEEVEDGSGIGAVIAAASTYIS